MSLSIGTCQLLHVHFKLQWPRSAEGQQEAAETVNLAWHGIAWNAMLSQLTSRGVSS